MNSIEFLKRAKAKAFALFCAQTNSESLSTRIKKNGKIILVAAAIAYCIFGIYELYIDGAFASDIFKLLWI